MATGVRVPRLAAASLASGEPRGYDPSVAGRGDMPRPRKGGREADEIGRRSEGGTRSGSPSELAPPAPRRGRLAVLGVDLGGVERRPTGICLLRGWTASLMLLFSDEEILDLARREKPALVAIDAPLNLPPGRRTMADRNGAHYRPCDIELRRLGIPFFPITLGPMRGLTERGIRLKNALEAAGLRAVEIYPGGAQDVWGLPRAKRDAGALRRGLARLGVRCVRSKATDHELDALTGALVGRLFLQGKARVLGDFSTGAIVMPAPLRRPFRRRNR